ncbi:MAG: D-sedoheptulose 7-phosphate isomerase [archaeon GW2011_AR5]|uniref:Putative phosphoheptose isomerase n=1 Tax=Candidatus Uhrbacteria bacterium GW2011_GWC2_53_7 TaxID=1618986 RepID=A0A0G2A2B5_9BACT|nr:MAG: D-sedoheptulose 7-phosphate isomerase [archaeon GW2011_AR5]KKW35002.1 MAG: putative phosphoheptose isomerase [Candidatus Uhrbacteria bacterium GW2011_GWC2_53_7]
MDKQNDATGVMHYLKKTIDDHKEMVEKLDLNKIEEVASEITGCYKNGGKLIIFGNGGSAADAMAFATEFEGQLSSRDKGRKPLPAITPYNTSALTAMSNDYGYETSFVRFVQANAKRSDVVIGISTSGNSKNVLSAIKSAKELGAKTVGMTGGNGGELGSICDIHFNVPTPSCSIAQEGHLIAYHRICALVIRDLFGYDALV